MQTSQPKKVTVPQNEENPPMYPIEFEHLIWDSKIDEYKDNLEKEKQEMVIRLERAKFKEQTEYIWKITRSFAWNLA